jgi:hypothetical protein
LTDSVRCVAGSSNTFNCEVRLDSDFDTQKPEAEPATQVSPPPVPPMSSAPPASSPAVSTLVSAFVSKTLVPVETPLISVAALKECASSELGIVLASLTTAKHPLIAALTMAKAVIDAGQCLTDAHDAAAARNAEDYCRGIGGVVTAVEDNKMICEVRERAK